MSLRSEAPLKLNFTITSIVMIYYILSERNKTGPLSYDFVQFMYLDKGEYQCTLNGIPYHMKEGQLLLCPPHSERIPLNQKSYPVAYIGFRCDSPFIENLENPLFTLSPEQRKSLSALVTKGSQMFETLPRGQVIYGQALKPGVTDDELLVLTKRLEFFLSDLLLSPHLTDEYAKTDNQSNYYEQQFHLVENFLKNHITENLTVNDIVEYTGLSKSALIRLYHSQNTGGVIHHFTWLKLEEAKRLIKESDMTITQISDQMGFSSLHHFSKLFKRFYNISPREYAKSIMKK